MEGRGPFLERASIVYFRARDARRDYISQQLGVRVCVSFYFFVFYYVLYRS